MVPYFRFVLSGHVEIWYPKLSSDSLDLQSSLSYTCAFTGLEPHQFKFQRAHGKFSCDKAFVLKSEMYTKKGEVTVPLSNLTSFGMNATSSWTSRQGCRDPINMMLPVPKTEKGR